MKYLGIIIDGKFTFNEHIKYTTDRCTKLINALSKSARISWGLRHEALKIMYNGAILPQLLYTAPVWIESMKRKYNRANTLGYKDSLITNSKGVPHGFARSTLHSDRDTSNKH